MSNYVFWILETSVKEGQIENLRALMTEMVEATEREEPGTINYEWFVSPDNGRCAIFERYSDSDAALAHLTTFQNKYAARLMELVEVKRFTVYGNPSETLRNGLSAVGAFFMEPFGGFSR